MEKIKYSGGKTMLDIILAGIIFFLVLTLLLLTSCKHELPVQPAEVSNPVNNGNNNGNGGNGNNGGNESTCDPDTVYFQSEVLPLLISNCTQSSCHNAADHANGVILDSYSNIMATADVRAGRPWGSDIYEVLMESDPDDRMPLDRPQLSADNIQLIYDWIVQGAQNNNCENNCDTVNVTYAGTVGPVLMTYCLGCHNGPAGGGQVDLSTHAGVSSAASSGRLIGAISHDPNYAAMPQGGAMLSDCKIEQIIVWINNGMPDN
jgi:hypothetical protein